MPDALLAPTSATIPQPSAVFAWFGVFMTFGTAGLSRVKDKRTAAFCYANRRF
jgi:hypothetical protein